MVLTHLHKTILGLLVLIKLIFDLLVWYLRPLGLFQALITVLLLISPLSVAQYTACCLPKAFQTFLLLHLHW